MKKSGFFKMKASAAIGLIGFIVISLAAHLPVFRNTLVGGLNLCSWILSLLAIVLPIYCIIVESAELKAKDQDK